MKSTVSIQKIPTETMGMIPIMVPNKVVEGKGFYVSFNNYDIEIYGCSTTALVDNDMIDFFILKGDHRSQYNLLIDKGYIECLEYFKSQEKFIHKYSSKIDEDRINEILKRINC